MHNQLLLTFPPLIVAVVLHEIAHGLTAEKLGDPTARQLGRITLNPIPHIDPIMTIALPFMLYMVNSPFLFGGAKPVPVDPRHFRDPRRGMMWVAIAGPAMNILLAGTCAVILRGIVLLDPPVSQSALIGYPITLLIGWCISGFIINIALACFNLFPIPPLDGGRILVGLLPLGAARTVSKIEPYGIFILIALLTMGAVKWVLGPLVMFFANLLAPIMGLSNMQQVLS